MRRILLIALCALVTVGVASAQQRRMYNDGQVDFAPGSARFVLTADELDTGLSEIEYRVNGGEAMIYEDPIRLSDEGRHVITYRATDLLGNVSREEAYTVVIDDTAPGMSATARGHAFVEDNAAYLRSDTAIIVSASDSASGVEGVFVSLDNENFIRYSDVAYVNEEGEHRGYAYAEDNVGNRSRTYSIRAYVDNTAPEVLIVPRQRLTTVQGDRYTSSGNQFVVRATDAVAGIDTIEVSINRQEFAAYTGPVSFDEPGLQSIRARATDRLGNTSDIVELSFYVDTAVPQPTLRAIIEE
jgi:hypothetical protein